MVGEQSSLSAYVNDLQASGRYTFTKEAAIGKLGVSALAFRRAAARLVEKRRLAVPRRGFYVIVPVEYRVAGSPPAVWFIDAFMRHLGERYYVGVLSAAALHGAGHQQPQELQVVVGTPLRSINVGRVRVTFFRKRRLDRTPTTKIKTDTGTAIASTPEATVFDLVHYANRAAGLSNVATAISELGEDLDPRKLLRAAKAGVELACVQRTGLLLDLTGSRQLADPLARWLAAQSPRLVALRPGRGHRRAAIDRRWMVRVNEKVEAEA
jgi:predicted transcriptional regulator of viral defense system